MKLQVDTSITGQVLVARLIGELDHHTAAKARDQLEVQMMTHDIRHLLLNLKELDFMDSSGIGMILGRYKQLHAKGGKMGLCEMSPAVYKLAEMSGLFKIMVVGETERQALSRLEVYSR